MRRSCEYNVCYPINMRNRFGISLIKAIAIVVMSWAPLVTLTTATVMTHHDCIQAMIRLVRETPLVPSLQKPLRQTLERMLSHHSRSEALEDAVNELLIDQHDFNRGRENRLFDYFTLEDPVLIATFLKILGGQQALLGNRPSLLDYPDFSAAQDAWFEFFLGHFDRSILKQWLYLPTQPRKNLMALVDLSINMQLFFETNPKARDELLQFSGYLNKVGRYHMPFSGFSEIASLHFDLLRESHYVNTVFGRRLKTTLVVVIREKSS